MADESTAQAPTSFAEFEAGGGTYNPPSPSDPKSEPEPESSAAAESQTAAEPDTAEPEPEQDQEETQPPPKQKRTLSSDHEKMLKEVKEMRREKRELQQELQQLRQPAPPAAQSTPSRAEEDKEPVRPSIDSWQGTLAEFDEENRKTDKELIAFIEKKIAKREQARQAEEQQQRVSNAYNEKLMTHIKDHPEYGEQIQQTPMSDLMANIIFTEGPALGQILIDRQDEARRIKALPHEVQIFEMGVLFGSIKKNGKVKSNPEPEEEEEPSPPVKVPAKLTASSTPHAAKGADHGAKNFGQWEAAELRLAQSNLKRR